MPRRIRTRWPLAAAFAALATVSLAAGAASAAGPAVAGRVVGDHRGSPVAGAAVALQALETDHARLVRRLRGGDPPADAAAKTGEDGRFRLVAPAEGMWVLSVAAPGYAPVEHDLTALLADEELGDLELRPAETVRVEVRDATGHPVEGALVEGREEGGPRRGGLRSFGTPVRRARTGPDGRAVLPRAKGATLHVVAVAPGQPPSEPLEVAGAAASIVLPPARPRRVRIERPAGDPVAGAAVMGGTTSWLVPLGITDADGALLAVHQPDGERLTLVVYGPDGRVVRETLPALAQEGAPGAGPPQPIPPFVVQLPAPGIVSGRTLADPGRSPVAGAWVWPTADPARHVRSDDRGGFSLRVGQDEARVSAEAAGHGSAFISASRDLPAVTLLLPVRARLAGRVVDDEDRPVTDAEVTARSPERAWQGERRTRTDREGRFALEVEAFDGHYLLRAERAGWVPAQISTAAPAAGAAKTGVRLVLRRGRTAHGRVLDEEDEPVVGARVGLSPSPEGQDVWRMGRAGGKLGGSEATTDPEGRFVVRDLGGGRYDLAIEAAGFAPAAVPGVEVPEGAGETDLGSVILSPGRRVTGRVVDAEDRPVEGASVAVVRGRQFALGLPDDDAEPEATSAADGWFEVVDLAGGQPVTLVVARSGYAIETVPGVTPPTREPLQVVLHPTATIRGTVVGPRDEPVEGAQIWARTASRFLGGPGRGGSRGQERARSDESGAFELTGVEPGEIVLNATAKGYQRREVPGITVAPGRSHEGVRVELELGGQVRGTVSDADGDPVEGTWVQVEEERDALRPAPAVGAPTDAEGRYAIDGVPPGRRTISARHDDHVRAVRDLEVTLGENRLDFRLEPGLEVRGRVLDMAGGPIAAARVSLVTDARMWTSTAATTGDDGGFVLTGVESGTYRARVEKQGYAEAISETFPVTAPIDGLELRLERGATIVGRVVGADPDDLASLRIFGQRQDGGHGSAMATVDFEGRFRLEGVLPGEWMVVATVGIGGRMATARLEVPPGAVEVPVTIELGGGVTLEGEILSRGEPLLGMTVAAMSADRMGGGMATSDHRGNFRIEGLEPGEYQLHVLRPGTAMFHREDLRLDADRKITVDLDPATVRGRVIDAEDGTAVAGAKLKIELPDAELDGLGQLLGLELATAPDGTFRLADLSPGSYVLVATAEGFQAARRPVELAPGAELGGIEIELRRSTASAELVVRAAEGTLPDAVVIVVLPSTGDAGTAQPVVSGRFPVGAGGRVRVPGLAPGSWQLFVGGFGFAAASAQVILPGPPAQVTLTRSAILSVHVPALADAGQPGEIRLRDAAGEPFLHLDFLGKLRESFPLVLGRGQVPDVPLGTWTVVVTAADGRTWTGQATLAPGGTQDLLLD